MSWWSGQREFGRGREYPEDRTSQRLAIRALSERDARPGKSEGLHFQTRPTGEGGAQFSADIWKDDRRNVSIEPQYYGGNARAKEQKQSRQSNSFSGSYPDWVARAGGAQGALISFDLKVPRRFGVGTFMQKFGTDTQKEFEKRAGHLPQGSEQRLVFDLNSYGALTKKQQHKAFLDHVERYKETHQKAFYAHSVQYIYRGKSGDLKASKPYAIDRAVRSHSTTNATATSSNVGKAPDKT